MSKRRRHSGNRENPAVSKCIGCFGLSLVTRERDVYDLFSRYGDIDDVQLVYDNHTGRSRGFAFVYFKELSAAQDAKEKLHGVEVDGRSIRCDYSITKRAHTPTPGVYLGKPTSRDDRESRGYGGPNNRYNGSSGAGYHGGSRSAYDKRSDERYDDRYDDRYYSRRSRSRSYDRSYNRSYDRGYDRGGYDRPSYDRSYDRGGYERGHDRYERGSYYERRY